MLSASIASSGSIRSLESAVRFASQRQSVIAHNIANISTPEFRTLDLPVRQFQSLLADAIDRKRDRSAPAGDDQLDLRSTRTFEFSPSGGFRATPVETEDGLTYHDRSSRDVEKLMQDLAENVGYFRVASDLLKSRFDLLRTAISERP